MSKTHKIHEFDPQIFPRLLWVAVGVPYEVVKDMFEEVSQMDKNSNAQVDNVRRLKPDMRGGLLVRFKNMKELTSENITHESTHVATEIFDYIGAYLDPKNQEPFSYLAGWVAKCIEKVKLGKE